MALSMGQMPVSGTMPIFTVPPGPCAVTMYAGAGTVYTGLSTAVTTTDGMPVTTTPVTFQCWPSSQGAQLYATTGSTAATVSVCYVVSTAR